MNWGVTQDEWGTSSSHHNSISWKSKLRLEGVVAMFPSFRGPQPTPCPGLGQEG